MSMFANILAAANKAKAGGSFSDDKEGFWSCETDKAGNGLAIIRFVGDAFNEEAIPFVKVYSHSFKSASGKWYIENCPTTIGNDCPVCSAGSILWNSGIEANKEIVRQRKRKTSFISNVFIVSDPAHPENEGKIFLWKYGQKIFEKLLDAMQPTFADEVAFNPFDLKTGADFKLKIRKVDGYANYDKSEFDKPSDISGSVDMKQYKDVSEFIAPAKFKSYDELDKRFKAVTSSAAQQAETAAKEQKQNEDAFAPAPTKAAPKAAPVDSDDDDLDYFKSLADMD
jgi:hypothetical protein